MRTLRRSLSALLIGTFCLPNPAYALRPEPDRAGVEEALRPAAGAEEAGKFAQTYVLQRATTRTQFATLFDPQAGAILADPGQQIRVREFFLQHLKDLERADVNRFLPELTDLKKSMKTMIDLMTGEMGFLINNSDLSPKQIRRFSKLAIKLMGISEGHYDNLLAKGQANRDMSEEEQFEIKQYGHYRVHLTLLLRYRAYAHTLLKALQEERARWTTQEVRERIHPIPLSNVASRLAGALRDHARSPERRELERVAQWVKEGGSGALEGLQPEDQLGFWPKDRAMLLPGFVGLIRLREPQRRHTIISPLGVLDPHPVPSFSEGGAFVSGWGKTPFILYSDQVDPEAVKGAQETLPKTFPELRDLRLYRFPGGFTTFRREEREFLISNQHLDTVLGFIPAELTQEGRAKLVVDPLYLREIGDSPEFRRFQEEQGELVDLVPVDRGERHYNPANLAYLFPQGQLRVLMNYAPKTIAQIGFKPGAYFSPSNAWDGAWRLAITGGSIGCLCGIVLRGKPEEAPISAPAAGTESVFSPDGSTLIFQELIRDHADLFGIGKEALELGMGDGGLTLAMAQQGAEVTAVDSLPAALELFERNRTSQSPAVAGKIRAGVSNLYANLPKITGKQKNLFDVVVFNNPIFLRDPETPSDAARDAGRDGEVVRRALQGLLAHLKPDGDAFILAEIEMNRVSGRWDWYRTIESVPDGWAVQPVHASISSLTDRSGRFFGILRIGAKLNSRWVPPSGGFRVYLPPPEVPGKKVLTHRALLTERDRRRSERANPAAGTEADRNRKILLEIARNVEQDKTLSPWVKNALRRTLRKETRQIKHPPLGTLALFNAYILLPKGQAVEFRFQDSQMIPVTAYELYRLPGHEFPFQVAYTDASPKALGRNVKSWAGLGGLAVIRTLYTLEDLKEVRLEELSHLEDDAKFHTLPYAPPSVRAAVRRVPFVKYASLPLYLRWASSEDADFARRIILEARAVLRKIREGFTPDPVLGTFLGPQREFTTLVRMALGGNRESRKAFKRISAEFKAMEVAEHYFAMLWVAARMQGISPSLRRDPEQNLKDKRRMAALAQFIWEKEFPPDDPIALRARRVYPKTKADAEAQLLRLSRPARRSAGPAAGTEQMVEPELKAAMDSLLVRAPGKDVGATLFKNDPSLTETWRWVNGFLPQDVRNTLAYLGEDALFFRPLQDSWMSRSLKRIEPDIDYFTFDFHTRNFRQPVHHQYWNEDAPTRSTSILAGPNVISVKGTGGGRRDLFPIRIQRPGSPGSYTHALRNAENLWDAEADLRNALLLQRVAREAFGTPLPIITPAQVIQVDGIPGGESGEILTVPDYFDALNGETGDPVLLTLKELLRDVFGVKSIRARKTTREWFRRMPLAQTRSVMPTEIRWVSVREGIGPAEDVDYLYRSLYAAYGHPYISPAGDPQRWIIPLEDGHYLKESYRLNKTAADQILMQAARNLGRTIGTAAGIGADISDALADRNLVGFSWPKDFDSTHVPDPNRRAFFASQAARNIKASRSAAITSFRDLARFLSAGLDDYAYSKEAIQAMDEAAEEAFLRVQESIIAHPEKGILHPNYIGRFIRWRDGEGREFLQKYFPEYFRAAAAPSIGSAAGMEDREPVETQVRKLLPMLSLGTEEMREKAFEGIRKLGASSVDSLVAALRERPTLTEVNWVRPAGAAMALAALSTTLLPEQKPRVVSELNGILSDKEFRRIAKLDPQMEGHPHTWLAWVLPKAIRAFRQIDRPAADRAVQKLLRANANQHGPIADVLDKAIENASAGTEQNWEPAFKELEVRVIAGNKEPVPVKLTLVFGDGRGGLAEYRGGDSTMTGFLPRINVFAHGDAPSLSAETTRLWLDQAMKEGRELLAVPIQILRNQEVPSIKFSLEQPVTPALLEQRELFLAELETRISGGMISRLLTWMAQGGSDPTPLLTGEAYPAKWRKLTQGQKLELVRWLVGKIAQDPPREREGPSRFLVEVASGEGPAAGDWERTRAAAIVALEHLWKDREERAALTGLWEKLRTSPLVSPEEILPGLAATAQAWQERGWVRSGEGFARPFLVLGREILWRLSAYEESYARPRKWENFRDTLEAFAFLAEALRETPKNSTVRLLETPWRGSSKDPRVFYELEFPSPLGGLLRASLWIRPISSFPMLSIRFSKQRKDGESWHVYGTLRIGQDTVTWREDPPLHVEWFPWQREEREGAPLKTHLGLAEAWGDPQDKAGVVAEFRRFLVDPLDAHLSQLPLKPPVEPPPQTAGAEDSVIHLPTYGQDQHRISVGVLATSIQALNQFLPRLRDEIHRLPPPHLVAPVLVGFLKTESPPREEWAALKKRWGRRILQVEGTDYSDLLFRMTGQARRGGSTILHVTGDQVSLPLDSLSRKVESLFAYQLPSVFISKLAAESEAEALRGPVEMTFFTDAHFVMERRPGRSFLQQVSPYLKLHPAASRKTRALTSQPLAYRQPEAWKPEVVSTYGLKPADGPLRVLRRKQDRKAILPGGKQVLFLEPHSDDYALTAAALLKELLVRKNEVRILTWGNQGSKDYWTLLSQERAEENRAALRVIEEWAGRGRPITYKVLPFKVQRGWDPAVFASLRRKELAEVAARIEKFAPDLIVIPAAEDMHRTHVRFRALALEAAQVYVNERGKPVEVIQVPLFSAEETVYESANLALPLSAEDWQWKRRALDAFGSQAEYTSPDGKRFPAWFQRVQERAGRLSLPRDSTAVELFWLGVLEPKPTVTIAAGAEQAGEMVRSLLEGLSKGFDSYRNVGGFLLLSAAQAGKLQTKHFPKTAYTASEFTDGLEEAFWRASAKTAASSLKKNGVRMVMVTSHGGVHPVVTAWALVDAVARDGNLSGEVRLTNPEVQKLVGPNIPGSHLYNEAGAINEILAWALKETAEAPPAAAAPWLRTAGALRETAQQQLRKQKNPVTGIVVGVPAQDKQRKSKPAALPKAHPIKQAAPSPEEIAKALAEMRRRPGPDSSDPSARATALELGDRLRSKEKGISFYDVEAALKKYHSLAWKGQEMDVFTLFLRKAIRKANQDPLALWEIVFPVLERGKGLRDFELGPLLKEATQRVEASRLKAAGAEQTPQRLRRIARRMREQGWIESAGRFGKEWARAWYLASGNLQTAELFDEPADAALWKTRLQSLSDFIRLLEALFTEELSGNPLEVLSYTHGRSQARYHARVRLKGEVPITALIEMNRQPDFPRLSVWVPGIGQFRIGRDADRSVARPLIHLDIHDRTNTQWWSHRNLVPAWSNGEQRPLDTFHRFQQRMIARIEQLAQREEGDRRVAAGVEEVVQALEKLFAAAPGSIGPEVLVFTEPESFDLVPLALRWGKKVAVLSDGPEAEALRELLESIPAQFPAGSYAIGYVPASRFLENVRQIWVENEAHGLRVLQLPPELADLPEPVAELLRAVHRVLSIAASA